MPHNIMMTLESSEDGSEQPINDGYEVVGGGCGDHMIVEYDDVVDE